jgi:sulfopyruvate decarboxylase subunit alpha
MQVQVMDRAGELCDELVVNGFGPFFGTPCGILSRLLTAIEERAGMLTVAREDNAVGIAAGAALAGRCPVVLMQNSGLGQSVNALASLVTPYRIPMLLVVSLRGVDPDPTQENLVMGRLTEPLLRGLGVEVATLDPDRGIADQVSWAVDMVQRLGRPAALLIPPAAFGWRA